MVLCRTEVAAQEALAVVRAWTSTVGLTLHPVKTRIVDTTQDDGFDFLGYHFESGQRWPRQKSLETHPESPRAGVLSPRRRVRREFRGDFHRKD